MRYGLLEIGILAVCGSLVLAAFITLVIGVAAAIRRDREQR